MKKYLFAALALLFVSCNQNEPTRGAKSVKNATFYCIEEGTPGEYDTEYFLLFDRPSNKMVTDSISTKWHIEPAYVDNTPIVWEYSIDGSQIIFKINHSGVISERYATFRNDTIYLESRAYHRL